MSVSVENKETVEVDKTLKRIWLGNLPTNTNRAELEDLCLSCGKVIKIDYREGGTFGFVTFQSHEDADFAIYKVNGRNFHNQVLKARWSDKEVKKPETREKSSGPRYEKPKPKKERKPMMSLTHLTPRNEPSRVGVAGATNANANFEWKANQNAQIVDQSGHNHQLDHTQNQSHNHQYNQNNRQHQNQQQNYNQHQQNNNYQQNNSNYNSHNKNHFPNHNNQHQQNQNQNQNQNQQGGGWIQ
jgi:RNA recognition motif-containing protein